MSAPTCGACRYFRASVFPQAEDGECRHSPPTMKVKLEFADSGNGVIVRDTVMVPQWPVLGSGELCGRFMPSDENVSCGSCRYFVSMPTSSLNSNVQLSGECWLHPPLPDAGGYRHLPQQARRPNVLCKDKCGQFAPADPVLTETRVPA